MQSAWVCPLLLPIRPCLVSAPAASQRRGEELCKPAAKLIWTSTLLSSIDIGRGIPGTGCSTQAQLAAQESCNPAAPDMSSILHGLASRAEADCVPLRGPGTQRLGEGGEVRGPCMSTAVCKQEVQESCFPAAPVMSGILHALASRAQEAAHPAPSLSGQPPAQRWEKGAALNVLHRLQQEC